jgi:8-amino-7-oxononanoate synthase
LDIEKRLIAKLEQRKEKQTFRSLMLPQNKVDFSSNDYLGFATDGLLVIESSDIHLSGAKASRLISGNSDLHEEIEQLLAAYHHAPTGLLFNSGYDANVGLMGCIAQKGDCILYDELSHASIRDGLRMSLASSFAFKHNDLEDLERLLKEKEGYKFVVTEGIFSMDGDLSPLLEIVECCKKYQAAIIVDEAHSGGVIEKQGRGWVSELGLEKEIFARVHTFGKALGCHGAVILGSENLRNYLINYARSFIFTTAISPHSLLYIQKAYELLERTNRIQLLDQNIKLFRAHLLPHVTQMFLPSHSPIQSLIITGADQTRYIAQQLQEKGFEVKPIVSPTVPLGEERIRICIHAFNKKEDILTLVDAINSLVTIKK